MTPRARQILRYLAHHTAQETAARFDVSERQVRRVLRESMDRLGCSTEYELFRYIERRPKRIGEEPLSLW